MQSIRNILDDNANRYIYFSMHEYTHITKDNIGNLEIIYYCQN